MILVLISAGFGIQMFIAITPSVSVQSKFSRMIQRHIALLERKREPYESAKRHNPHDVDNAPH